ncbi:phospholipase A(2) [Deinococcus maricopensis]|uniref:Phospholipase A2 n=1 Tax=Deinococcus maricopensis (strain DSM 21211 / LMG 22137 / NRRL B-23946 / LB-34) TaxID=709986 RepID=E8U3U2_DEIML|nr:phospholipase A(2) [Deinococcus maricopensis]ADV68785.1 phospholipase A2 [Deinococcus maricopensis DSM 21211]
MRPPHFAPVMMLALLTACGTATPAAPADTASSLNAQYLLPDEPICDATMFECPGGDTGGTSYFRYWTLDQVTSISARAAYAVNISRGPLDAFQQERAQNAGTPGGPASSTPYANLDWSNDGCSAPWYTSLLTFGQTALYAGTFREACEAHDFAYRNVGRIANEAQVASGQRDTVNHEALRQEIDAAFLRNMKGICDGRSALLRWHCNSWADTFYNAVRKHGQSSWTIW